MDATATNDTGAPPTGRGCPRTGGRILRWKRDDIALVLFVSLVACTPDFAIVLSCRKARREARRRPRLPGPYLVYSFVGKDNT